jgi:hypothetical protein
MPSNDEMSELRALLHADRITDAAWMAIAELLFGWPKEGRIDAHRYAMGVIAERGLLAEFVTQASRLPEMHPDRLPDADEFGLWLSPPYGMAMDGVPDMKLELIEGAATHRQSWSLWFNHYAAEVVDSDLDESPLNFTFSWDGEFWAEGAYVQDFVSDARRYSLGFEAALWVATVVMRRTFKHANIPGLILCPPGVRVGEMIYEVQG